MSNAPRQSVILTAIRRKHISPCKDCTDRVVGCHGKCERFAEYKKIIDAEGYEAFTALKNERIFDNANIRAKEKTIKNGGRGGKQKWSMYKGGYK